MEDRVEAGMVFSDPIPLLPLVLVWFGKAG